MTLFDFIWRALGSKWRKQALLSGLLDLMAYRFDFFFKIITDAFVPLSIQFMIWWSLFRSTNQASLGGYDSQSYLQYLCFSLLFVPLRSDDTDFTLQELIRTGGLSQYLLKPVSYLELIWLRSLGPRLMMLVINLCISFFLCHYFHVPLGRLLPAFSLALIGNLIQYMVGCVVASVSFYWEEAHTMIFIKNMIVGLLCGELIPLDLFPESLRWLWKSFPFYLYVFGPTQIIRGAWSFEQSTLEFLKAGLWILVLTFLIKMTWARGLRRYVALGG